MRVGVGRTLGQGLHLGRDAAEHGRHRQLTAQVVQLGQVVANGHVGLALQGQLQSLGGDIGVAVAIAANPLAHAQKRRHALLARQAQVCFQVAIQAGNFGQERALVVAQGVVDFIGHGEFGKTQQAGLPELRDARFDQSLVALELARQQHLALGQQAGDGALGVQNAFALHLGGVGGEHWADVALGQGFDDVGFVDAGLAQARQCHRQATRLQIPSAFVHGAAADVVAVFGQIGQVTEVGEGADHADRLVAGQGLEEFFELLVGAFVGVSAKGHREFSNLFDALISCLALLLTNHIAQNAAQQADVVDQGLVFVVAAGGHGSVGWPKWRQGCRRAGFASC